MRGQSAVEYLVTYGWAVLVLVILLALLFSSGIFSPGYLISEECNLGPKLPCKFVLYEKDGNTNIVLQITNSFGYKIKLTSVSMLLPDENRKFTATFTDAAENPPESGSSVRISGAIPDYKGSKSSIKKINVAVGYYSCADEVNPQCTDPEGDDATHTITGKIIGRVI